MQCGWLGRRITTRFENGRQHLKHVSESVKTGDGFAEGGEHIRQTLARHQAKGSFFFTGNFYRNADFRQLIKNLAADGPYLGAHSDAHLLYCTWEKRDSLSVTREEFEADLTANCREMEKLGISKGEEQIFNFNRSNSAFERKLLFHLYSNDGHIIMQRPLTSPGFGRACQAPDDLARLLMGNLGE